MCDPCNFCFETFEMLFFCRKRLFRDEDWEVTVSHTHLLYSRIEEVSDLLPDGI